MQLTKLGRESQERQVGRAGRELGSSSGWTEEPRYTSAPSCARADRDTLFLKNYF